MEAQLTPLPDEQFVLALFADGLKPDPRRTVHEWAEARRIVTEGAYPGPWRTARTPYLREPMERATLAHPCRRITMAGSAQVAKTNLGLNLLGQVLEETPAKALVVLPSLTSARMYNRDKLEPMLQASPALVAAVADITSRDGAGSTTTVKRGARDAQVEIVTASSSKDLQSRTCRLVILEEVSEYPLDVDGRGDPVDLALARTIAWRKAGEKVLAISTPAIKGACRITRFLEEGSDARFHVPCPHCATPQPLQFGNLTWPEGQPEKAAYACTTCGALIEERDKPAMLTAGRWVHAHPERESRHSSYHINALYSPFTPWSEIAREADAAQAAPSKQKAFCQQWKGEPWDEAFDLPKADILLLRRDRWPPRRIPPGVLFLMGATDVQQNRLVWAVWGFDRHFGQWLIDTGTLHGDPTRPDVWSEHDTLLRTTWLDAWGKPRQPLSWGVDSGYLSSHVYAYVRRHGADHLPKIKALDGKAGWRLPALGSPRDVEIDFAGRKSGKVALWPVGTWDIKSELAGALRLTEQGPGPDGWPNGAIRYNEQIDRPWLEEMLSEFCDLNPRTGARTWRKVAARNEAWDLAVYTRALARHYTLGMTEERWNALTREVEGPPAEAQTDFASIWAPTLRDIADAARTVAPPPPPPPAAPRPAPAFIPRRTDWLGTSERGWL